MKPHLIKSAALSLFAFALVLALGCSARSAPGEGKGAHSGHHAHHVHHPAIGEKFVISDDEWKKKLTPEQYYILREQGTERAWTGALLDNKGKGTYRCAGCGAPLFDSDTKYNSGSGWPSFYTSLAGRVLEKVDSSHGMVRTEVVCARCGGHLGHKFPDGPQPTGQRYCINSIAMEFDGGPAQTPAKK